MTTFEGFWGEVKNKHLKEMREEIEATAEVSQVSFDNWRSGRFEPDSRFWPVINTVAVKYGYDKPYLV